MFLESRYRMNGWVKIGAEEEVVRKRGRSSLVRFPFLGRQGERGRRNDEEAHHYSGLCLNKPKVAVLSGWLY